MDERDESREGPLKSEELARDEWRDDEPGLKERDAPGHTLPESERDASGSEGGSRTGAISGTILPPD